jgi:DNA-binding Lrp family transcriptional regulator
VDSPEGTAVVPMAILTDQRLSCGTRLVLTAMTAYATNGVVTISQVELAQKLGVTPQAVSKALQPAQAAGLIERVKSRCGALTWRLTWHQPAVDDDQPTVDADQPAVDSPRARTRLRTPRTSTSKSLVVSLTDEETAKVHAHYDKTLGAAMVTNQIAIALDYARGKGTYSDFYRFVMNWLIKPEREAVLHATRMATEQARLERAKTPYGGAVTEPTLKFTNIRDIVGRAS